MLREIGRARQDGARGMRRWFQDDYFDLYVWQDADGAPIAMQLCYDRDHMEGTIAWSADVGYTHARVDPGRNPGRHAMSPILRASSAPPYFRIYPRFLHATREWNHELLPFVLERLQTFRTHLFGRRRPIRRRDRLRRR